MHHHEGNPALKPQRDNVRKARMKKIRHDKEKNIRNRSELTTGGGKFPKKQRNSKDKLFMSFSVNSSSTF